MTDDLRSCPTCGFSATVEARFCASCGSRLEGDADDDTRAAALPRNETGPVPVAYMRAEARLFGVVPPLLTLGLACFLFALALVGFATGHWIVGLALLAFSGALFGLAYEAARRDRTSAVARAAVAASSGVRAWAAFAGESVRAWSEAGRNLLRLRRELRALRRERNSGQFELGGAAYREDEAEVVSLRARLRETDDAIADRERAAAETLEQARRRVTGERVAIQPTQQLSPEEAALVRGQADASPAAADAVAKSREKSHRKKRKPARGA